MLISGLIHSHHIKQCLLARIPLRLTGAAPARSFSASPGCPIQDMPLSPLRCLLDGSGAPVYLLQYHHCRNKSFHSFLPPLVTSASWKNLALLGYPGKERWRKKDKGSQELPLKSWMGGTRWRMANRWPLTPASWAHGREHHGVSLLDVSNTAFQSATADSSKLAYKWKPTCSWSK